MTVSFEVSLSFFEEEEISLSADDLKFGLDRGWLRPEVVIELAEEELRKGNDDPILLEIASLLKSDDEMLAGVLTELDSPLHIHDPRMSSRKWLYFQLKAAYRSRSSLPDPLGVVEQIYADFDYPKTIESFVRYMPLQDGDEPGIDALIERWKRFLDREHDALVTETSNQ